MTHSRRIAVFGGTFNPPHLGHLIVAEAAHDQLGLDLVLWMPAEISPDKIDNERQLVAHHRVQMAHLTTHNRSEFEVSTLEVERGGVSYTVETLELLTRQYTDSKLLLLLGGDTYRSFGEWKNPDRIAELADLVVYDRNEMAQDPPHHYPAIKLKSPMLDISSSDIRARVNDGRSIRYLVTDSVRSYIRINQLYRNQ